ncbi:Aristolochene synthase in complex with 12,13 Difluorofarnesyl diphosphate, partial [Viridothelium virens]
MAATVQLQPGGLPEKFPDLRGIDQQRLNQWSFPSSNWSAHCHPLVEKVSEEVNEYFLKFWPFPDDKARTKFVGAEFPKVTCLYFPLAKDERISHACELLTILFLIDDQLEGLSLSEGALYNQRLMEMCRGDSAPDSALPAEWMMFALWQKMRKCDKNRADELQEPVFLFMRAQTSRARLNMHQLGQYLDYRQKDVGQARVSLLASLMRYTMSLELKSSDLEAVREIELNVGRHISIVNDILSFEKELKTSMAAHEGSTLCPAVNILSSEARISYDAAKHVLWTLCREYEATHEKLARSLAEENGQYSTALELYIRGLEYQMSGNELWSRTTKRYK